MTSSSSSPTCLTCNWGTRRRGARLAQGEAAVVEVKIAGNRAGAAVRLDLERSGYASGDIVAVEQQRLFRIEVEIERQPRLRRR